MKKKSKPLTAQGEKKFSHYWMCLDCAKAKGGVETEGCCTVIRGTCEYCELPIEQTLIPWVDFDWPADNNATKRARLARD